jgi:hypothetical protein
LFRQRPFAQPAESEELSPQAQELPDLQTQLDREDRFGYNFSRVKVESNIPAVIQPKLANGAPGDKYEQEADQLAAKVMSMPEAANHQPIQHPRGLEQDPLQRQMKRWLQRSADSDSSFEARDDIENQLSSSKGVVAQTDAVQTKVRQVIPVTGSTSNQQLQREPDSDEEANYTPAAPNYTPAEQPQEPNYTPAAPNASHAPDEPNASYLPQSAMASGIFQELTYPVSQSLPGPQPGTTARYNLSFRDKSGFPDPTSHAYLNRTSPAAGTRWKGLRLDHGPNVRTGGTTNWHWNQDGAGRTFGIPDHTVASPGAANFGRAMKYAKPLGRGALAVGAAMDAYSLGSEINQSAQTGNWDNTIVEGSRVAGGWGGAWAGAEAVGTAGAAIGTFIAPGLGTAIGGAIGGLAGGALGYFGGSALGKWLGEEATE